MHIPVQIAPCAPATRRRRGAVLGLALAGALALSACGGGSADTTRTGSSASGHGSGHSTDGDTQAAKGNDADVAFLAGMVPHHAQAVEMSDIVLASDPPAEVAAIARQIKDAQAPEIEQMTAMLSAMGQSTDPAAHGGHSGGHAGGHGGMMTAQELAALKAATGTEAARMYLRLMVEHHKGAIEASETEIAQGAYRPAIELARQIKTAQAAEIAAMQQLSASL